MYTPFYCEENVWQLAKKMSETKNGSSLHGFVLFFVGAHSYIAMKNQVAFKADLFGFWDYHVVLFDADSKLIFDRDSSLGCPFSAESYFTQTFPRQDALAPEVRTTVRSVPIDEYLKRFSSDRSHMLDESGNAIETFPSWPAIVAEDPIWLEQYRSVAEIEGSASELADVEGFARRLGEQAKK